MPTCPNCAKHKIIKYGKNHYNKQRFYGKDCGRQVVTSNNYYVSQQKRDQINLLFRDRIIMRQPALSILR